MTFQIIALAILAAFYACYYAKMLHQRSKGIRTDHLGRGKTGFARRVERAVRLTSMAVPAAEIISIALNSSLLPLWARIAGAAIAAAGVIVFAASVLTMGDSWRAGVSAAEKTELVTTGIYSVSRNPAFLGFDLVYAGMLMMFFSWPLLAISALGAVMFHLQIVNVEEDFLLNTFGGEYLNYRRRVNRYLGRK